jgi:hypothetical protein
MTGVRWGSLAVAAALLAALAVLVVSRPAGGGPPTPVPARWASYAGPGYRIELPAVPHTQVVGSARVSTAVAGGWAYTIVRFTVPPGTPPLDALSRALRAVADLPSTLSDVRPTQIGRYATVDFRARTAEGYVDGRVIVDGTVAYLIGEVGPLPGAPADLTRLLSGFAPSPS